MFVVVLAEAGQGIMDDLAYVAQVLSLTLYEARVLLAAGTPQVLITTKEPSRAETVAGALRQRGYGAVVVPAKDVVPSPRMLQLRAFSLEREMLRADTAQPHVLPYADVHTLVRAMHRSATETMGEEKVRKFSVVKMATVGIPTRTVTQATKSVGEERSQVLYLFPFDGAPWILEEQGAKYTHMGEAMAPTKFANFQRAVELLRARMPHATFDARLTTPRHFSDKVMAHLSDGSNRVSSSFSVDLLAHGIAAHAKSKAASTPYR